LLWPPRHAQWWSEALHGVADSGGVSFRGEIPAATSFPQVCVALCALPCGTSKAYRQVILTAAVFNRSLYRAVGAMVSAAACFALPKALDWAPSKIGTEGRAMANADQAGLSLCALVQ
jgi:hypothetical protein